MRWLVRASGPGRPGLTSQNKAHTMKKNRAPAVASARCFIYERLFVTVDVLFLLLRSKRQGVVNSVNNERLLFHDFM